MIMRYSHPIEVLESRIAPAGLVAVAYNEDTGVLTLTGDVMNNAVSVFQTSSGGFRIEGLMGTILTPSATSYLDIGKLTSLTFNGGDGNDDLNLANLRTLRDLTLDGGIGADDFEVTNLSVSGILDVDGGEGDDSFSFLGLSTLVKKDVQVADAGDGITVDFDAGATSIGGSLLIQGGDGSDSVNIGAEGVATIKKGIRATDAAGGGLSLDVGSNRSVTIGKLSTGESVLFEGGEGNDVANVTGSSRIVLAGGVSFTGNGGADDLNLTNAQTLRVGKLRTGESVSFDGGLGNDDFNANGIVMALSGGVDFVGGDGMNRVIVGSANSVSKIGKLATGESLRFTGGINNDSAEFIGVSTVLAGGISFSPGDGGNTLEFDALNGNASVGKLRTGQSVLYTGGINDDNLTTGNNSFIAKGGLEFTAGAGENTLSFTDANGSVKLGKLSGGASIDFTGGAGEDSISLAPDFFTAAGGIDFAAGDGDNDVDLNNTGVLKIGRLPTGQSINIQGGADATGAAVGGVLVNLAGSFEVTGGTGSNSIEVQGSATRIGKNRDGESIRLVGGNDSDTLDFEGFLTLLGDVVFTSGSGNDDFDLTELDSLKVAGGISFDAGPGDDQFDAEIFQLSVAKEFSFLGGDDRDFVDLAIDGSIGGDVTLDLGGATTSGQVAILTSFTGLNSGLVLKGGLSVTSTASDPATDSFSLRDVAVKQAISISMGGGNSTVSIDNLVASNVVSILTGDGMDTVLIERGDASGVSIFTKLATIMTGNGNDTVFIGSPVPGPTGDAVDDTRARFLDGLTADGEAGTDSNNDFNANNDFPKGPTTPLNFETLVP